MKKITTFLVTILIYSSVLLAQESSQWGINFSGFVKTDYIFDSRQSVSAREGHLYLYPANEQLDAEGNDINAAPNFNILSIQTRLKGTITGPDAFGAKTSGVIEGAFFGHSNPDINGFRLRHAFVRLDWSTTTLLLGQYWHPMFIVDVFPGTVSFNTGMPFQPFSRNPQLRIIQKLSPSVALTFVAASQRDFSSAGPDGTVSTYLRNAVVPILNLDLRYKSDALILGAGGNFKSLRPRLATLANYEQTSKISAFSALAYGKVKSGSFTWKAEVIMGNNLNDNLMLGGYAVKSIDPVTKREEYTSVNNISGWTEFSYSTKELELGLFLGYTKNQGADDKVVGSVWARGANIDNIYRVSPRVQYTMGKTRFATEIEYTAAAYGTPDEMLKVSDTKTVSNLRVLLAAYYLF